MSNKPYSNKELHEFLKIPVSEYYSPSKVTKSKANLQKFQSGLIAPGDLAIICRPTSLYTEDCLAVENKKLKVKNFKSILFSKIGKTGDLIMILETKQRFGFIKILYDERVYYIHVDSFWPTKDIQNLNNDIEEIVSYYSSVPHGHNSP